MLSQSRRVFPAHQSSNATHSAGFPTLLPHHFFISFDQNSFTQRQQPGQQLFLYLFMINPQIKTVSHLLTFLVRGFFIGGSYLINKTFKTNLFKALLLYD